MINPRTAPVTMMGTFIYLKTGPGPKDYLVAFVPGRTAPQPSTDKK